MIFPFILKKSMIYLGVCYIFCLPYCTFHRKRTEQKLKKLTTITKNDSVETNSIEQDPDGELF